MQILDQRQIERKVRRLALQILENNLDAKQLYIGGINRNGQRFAQMIITEIHQQSSLRIENFHISLSPAAPLSKGVVYDIEADQLEGQNVLIIDDVANTGRTLFYACKPLMNVVPNKIEVAVLVDRKHKSFPVFADYVGLSLATTLMNDIRVRFEEGEEHVAYLL
jgi:pyrimidine operon attenuation protein/uracil phosphoribosyltransferase